MLNVKLRTIKEAKSMDKMVEGKITFYPTRTTVVNDVFLVLPRSCLDALEEALAKRCGKQPQNHYVIKIEQEKGNMCLWFTDDDVFIGHTVVPERGYRGPWPE